MPKNIVLLSDGTRNSETEARITNIAKLYYALNDLKANPKKQVHFYDRGIGTESNWLYKLWDSATGVGIGKNICDLYTYLVDNYEPGDDIYLFGFSRGAATVRSLGGMIRNIGILKKANRALVEEAYKIYIAEDGVDDAKADKFRKKNSYFDDVKIRFLGVYDTVVALGIPDAKNINLKWFGFHDNRLSRIIETARHALAVDERRNDFRPTLWTANPKHTDSEQRWFPGVHSDIGGSYQHHGLADMTYIWMMKEAEKCGLLLPDNHLDCTYSYVNVSNDAKSDDEEDMSEGEVLESREQQRLLSPNPFDKLHDSSKDWKRLTSDRKIGEGSSDETLADEIKQCMANKKKSYAPKNIYPLLFLKMENQNKDYNKKRKLALETEETNKTPNLEDRTTAIRLTRRRIA